jgi:hypothetical protein
MYIKWLQTIGLLSVAVLSVGPARADIDLRVEAHPRTDPIEAFVRVTDGGGSITGLTSADFAVTLDGAPLSTFTFGLPPDQDPTQQVSVVFVIAHTLFWGPAASPIRDAVTDFISQMSVGDYAAVIRFRPNNDDPLSVPLLQSFTRIDGGTGNSTLTDFVTTWYHSIYRTSAMSLFNALTLAVDQFASYAGALPDGPKAIILIGTGADYGSRETQSDVVAHANANRIPIFTIEIGGLITVADTAGPGRTARMASLAADTGANYFAAPDATSIAEAYGTLAGLLGNAYRLAIPPTAVTDCNSHMLEVTSRGQSASFAFTRCDSTPDQFDFADREGVAPRAVVVSNTVTITGIDGPVDITVTGGEYSIGCGSTFTSAPNFILPDDEVCVRHTASAEPNMSTETLLIVGGVPSSFWSSTSAAPPPPPPPPPPVDDRAGGGGGGGATGVFELLLALGALFARRRRGARKVLDGYKARIRFSAIPACI